MHTETMDELVARFEKMRAERPDAEPWLVLEGDWGGQIYLTVPWSKVGSDADIDRLLLALDTIAWSCNEGDGTSIDLYDPKQFGEAQEDGVPGGMGGGGLSDGLWLHEEFSACRVFVEVLLGLAPRVGKDVDEDDRP